MKALKMKDSANHKKTLRFLLEQQLPDAKVVKLVTSNNGGTRTSASTSTSALASEDAVPVSAVDHVTQVALETCRCIHLQEHLPHILDLELCKAIHHPRGWVVGNPVHSMHLASQLEDSSPASTHSKQPPILYGEEQQRTTALNTEGIVEYWCPLDGYSAVIHDDTAMDKMEHLPTLTNVHKQQLQVQALKSHSSPSSSTSSATAASAAVVPLPLLPSGPSKKQPQIIPSAPVSNTAADPTASGSKAPASPQVQTADPTNPPVSSPSMNPPPSPSLKPNPATTMSSSLPVIKEEGPSSADKVASSATTADPVPLATASGPPTPSSTGSSSAPAAASEPPSAAPPPTTSTSSATSTTTADTGSTAARAPSPYELTDHQFHHLRLEEDRIRLIRQSLSSHRLNKKKIDTKKKRKRESDYYKAPGIPGWRPSAPKELNPEQEVEWKEAMAASRAKVERWMDHFRLCRESYWDERQRQQSYQGGGTFYLSDPMTTVRCCHACQVQPQGSKSRDVSSNNNNNKRTKKKASKPRRRFTGDDLMQCLECSFVGCAPQSLTPDSRQHILQHLLVSGHEFAVSCGERAQVFCFRCGDFCYHELFEQEKQRIDYTKQLAFMSWKEHTVQRSFDPFQFIKTQDHGIVWRGLIATYPPFVPSEHFRATQLTSRRQSLFEGRVKEKWLVTKPNALAFSASQCLLDDADKYKVVAPVGMYNLGNTCFKSAILQCLVHCKPLQRYFLNDVGHHHESCQLYRHKEATKKKKKKNGDSAKIDSVCLACEMDRLFLAYYGSTIGKDVLAAIEEVCYPNDDDEGNDEIKVEKGDPLTISEMLTASWKSGGMNNLAGYEQHDAHEFLNSFLDLMGKHSRQHRDRVYSTINTVRDDNAMVPKTDKTQDDIVKQVFEGNLRSVLLCEECGGKRKMNEAFLNISLTLSEEVERLQAENGSFKKELSVETCLEHFILPEKLGDGVHCPTCRKKTATKKQHTFAKLPKVLCLHLKRFDAARNKKIDEFVSFPARGLNMGKFLSHWSEVTRVPSANQEIAAEPRVLYDLFGTVNHIGNMQSGHYVTNVRVADQWYHCNDAHIGRAGVDNGEEAVLKNEGAYILFYIRR